MKILMIEDDKPTIEVIKLSMAVCDPGTTIQSTENGREGISSVRTDNFDVVVLDLGLPDIDGMQVLEELRAFSKTPVLVVTARHDPDLITNALNLGAQDYVLKPFALGTFLSSLKEVSGKAKTDRDPDRVEQVSDVLTVRRDSHEVLVKGRPVELEPDEKQVLDILLDNLGTIVTVKTLAASISGSGIVCESTIPDIVTRLRKKLGDDPYHPQIIISEYRCGYRFLRSVCSLKLA